MELFKFSDNEIETLLQALAFKKKDAKEHLEGMVVPEYIAESVRRGIAEIEALEDKIRSA